VVIITGIIISSSSSQIRYTNADDWQVIATPPTNQRPAFGHPQTSGHHREVEPNIFPIPNPTGKMKAGQHKNPAYNPTRAGTLALAYAKKCD